MPYASRPSTSVDNDEIEKLKETVLESHSKEDPNIAYGSIQDILVYVLDIKRVDARLVPKDLNLLQQCRQKEVAKDMLENVAEDPTFIKRIITGDETWVYEYNVETVQ